MWCVDLLVIFWKDRQLVLLELEELDLRMHAWWYLLSWAFYIDSLFLVSWTAETVHVTCYVKVCVGSLLWSGMSWVCISIPWSDIDPSQHILFHVAFSLGSWWDKIGPFPLVQWAKWPLLHMEYCLSFQWTMIRCACCRTHECPDLSIW